MYSTSFVTGWDVLAYLFSAVWRSVTAAWAQTADPDQHAVALGATAVLDTTAGTLTTGPCMHQWE